MPIKHWVFLFTVSLQLSPAESFGEACQSKPPGECEKCCMTINSSEFSDFARKNCEQLPASNSEPLPLKFNYQQFRASHPEWNQTESVTLEDVVKLVRVACEKKAAAAIPSYAACVKTCPKEGKGKKQ